MIHIIEKKHYAPIFKIYKNSQYFFPLIGAVLQNLQTGFVFADDTNDPKAVFVVHKFGFSQYIQLAQNETNTFFLDELLSFIFVKQEFKNICDIQKLRIYQSGIHFKEKITNCYNGLYATTKRARLSISKKNLIPKYHSNKAFTIEKLSDKNIHLVEKSLQLNLCQRFWNNCNDVIEKSSAIIMKHEKAIVGICYSAAISNHYAEIDIYVDETYRRQKHAYSLLHSYLTELYENDHQALWDCYMNNLPSLNLALHSTFELEYEYDFFIINIDQGS